MLCNNWSVSVYRAAIGCCVRAGNLNADDAVLGYELYTSTLADVLSEPTLRTPITVGLFAKWGSGKSFLLDQLIRKFSCDLPCESD